METTQNTNSSPPDNNLVWAIICTVLCCLPLGIVAIIKSTKVKDLWAQGNHDAAIQHAADAKKWAIWGMIAGGAFWVIYIVLMLLGVAGGFLA